MEMKNAYIWGIGKNGRKVLRIINKANCQVKGFIDNDPLKHGASFEDIEVIPFKKMKKDYDVIVISIINYYAVLYQLNMEKNIDSSKVIVFWDDSYCDNPKYSHILDQQKWKIALLEQKLKKMEEIFNARLENIGYEIIDKYRRNLYQYPQINSTEEAVYKIVEERCSLVRYGDGEFEIMAGKERAVFQNYDPKLAKRLVEIISSKDEKLLIGIANNYGNLDIYTEDTADGIRLYMNEKIRNYHMSVLRKDRVYYDAYMFKSYFPYKNREGTWERVALVKRIWEEQNIVIIEGKQTRTGYKNNLFDNVKSLRRILCPMKNVFDKYNEVLNATLKLEKDCLILVVLGPVSNLLVFDLMKRGYQAVDIGQIDMDYEWYMMGAEKRVHIPDRYVSQLPPAEIEEVTDTDYLNQIIEYIS